MTVSPGQLTRRAEFYYQLGQLTGAGLGMVQSLKQLERNPPALSYRPPIRHVLSAIAEGQTVSEALRNAGSWLPEFDITVIEAGEKSGRLDASFRKLADYYGERARLMKEMIASLAYPAFLFHFFIFIISFPQLFLTGDVDSYLIRTFGVLIPIYAVIALLIYAGQSKHGEGWRRVVESVLDPLPMLGSGRRGLALARLSTALEALISAGVNIVEAWELAARASGSPALRRAVFAWRPLVEAGQTPAEVLQASARFPDLFVNQYTTGEISGKLDDNLRRLHDYYQEEGLRKLRAVAKWVPIIIYLVIVAVIARFIIQFYTGLFQKGLGAGQF
jgi:type II secretory pathway component PulF